MLKVLFFLFFCFPAMAMTYTYKDQPTQFDSYKNITRFNLQLKHTERFYTAGFNSFELVDQVFEGRNFTIKVATGRELLEKENLDKFIELSGYTLYHFKSGGLHVAIQFQGLSLEQMNDYVRDLKEFYSKKFSLLDFVIPSAHASAECNPIDFAYTSKSLDVLEKPMSVAEKNIFYTQMKSCLMNSLKAMEDNASNFGEGFMNFISNPVKGVENFWDTATQTYQGIKSVLSNLDQSFANLKSMLSGLSLSSIINISCQLAGDSIAESIKNFLTSGPLAFAKTAMLISSKIAMIAKVSKAIALFSKMNLSESKLGSLVQKMLNPKNQEKLKDLEEIADLKMQNFAMEYAQCLL